MIKIEYDDFKNVLECLVEQKKTFTIINIKNGISKVVKEVEKSIEERKMQCRVYTSSRSALVGGIFIPTGITQVTGIASAVGIAAHNIVTWEADYRIVKCLIDKEVEVIYKTYNPSNENEDKYDIYECNDYDNKLDGKQRAKYRRMGYLRNIGNFTIDACMLAGKAIVHMGTEAISKTDESIKQKQEKINNAPLMDLFESLKTSSSNKFEVINELKNRGWSVEELYNSEKISKEDYEKYK
ncbi:hypothetical protein [Bilophila wadsworthia]